MGKDSALIVPGTRHWREDRSDPGFLVMVLQAGNFLPLLSHMEEERLESRSSCGQLRRMPGKARLKESVHGVGAGRRFPHCL